MVIVLTSRVVDRRIEPRSVIPNKDYQFCVFVPPISTRHYIRRKSEYLFARNSIWQTIYSLRNSIFGLDQYTSDEFRVHIRAIIKH
jgi:hypothetical protein